jgi:hypothetical protein
MMFRKNRPSKKEGIAAIMKKIIAIMTIPKREMSTLPGTSFVNSVPKRSMSGNTSSDIIHDLRTCKNISIGFK